MEGRRFGEQAAPSWGAPTAHAARVPPAGIYVPRGWKLKRRRQDSEGQGPSKRRKPAAAATLPAAAKPAGQPSPPASAPRPAPNPAQLAPLRCTWPHPAVLHLLAQQAWPAAGAGALLQRAAGPAAAAPPWWDRMLPSLSPPYPPLAPERQLLLQAASSGASTSSATAEPLPQPSVLVGYEVCTGVITGCSPICTWVSVTASCVSAHVT